MDVVLRYPATLKVTSLAVGGAVDAGHANRPENDEVQRYRSCGGHVILLTDKAILDDERVPIAVLDWKTGMTQRVCRSTLAAEASHLANAVEAVDWATIVLQEILKGKLNLKRWQEAATATPRFWATDCKSVYDYLTKEGTSMSKDKRMAIEGALLKETLRSPCTTLRWIDGSQNLADVLTCLGRLCRTRWPQRVRNASRRRGAFAKRTRALPKKTQSVESTSGEPLRWQSYLLPAGAHFKSSGM